MSTPATLSLITKRLALGVLCLASACSFETKPSLGWQELAGPAPDPNTPRPADPQVFDAGGADAMPAPDSNPPHPSAGSAALSGTPPNVAGSNAAPAHDGDAGPMPVADAAAIGDGAAGDANTTPLPCPVGTFSGDYMCTIDVTGTAMMMSFGFDLQAASPGLATTDSGIMFDFAGSLFAATLQGELDCVTGAFHADINNGAGILAPIPVLAGFTGRINAQLQSSRDELVGDWALLSPVGVGNCLGAWAASQ